MGIKSRHVVFVTGAFVTHHGWNPWIQYFGEKGYTAIAPSWPFKEGTARELRARQPNDTDLAGLKLQPIVDHYAKIIRALPEKPIVIGHSTGGLITQKLVNMDLAAAGVAIHSVPSKGVIPYELSFLRAGWRSLGLFTSGKTTYLMSLETWQYAFTNGMPLAEQEKAWEENVVPESKTLARTGFISEAATVDYDKPHAPLLFTSGDQDHIIPATLNYRNWKRYRKDNGSITDYKDFPGRNHFVLGQPTWKGDADYILEWLGRLPG
jgi:pimeloyl-ACP methyl ester carboxylesterase